MSSISLRKQYYPDEKLMFYTGEVSLQYIAPCDSGYIDKSKEDAIVKSMTEKLIADLQNLESYQVTEVKPYEN